jgi:UDP:flavonoid glycosyltransferase YjiC (YdhE family)
MGKKEGAERIAAAFASAGGPRAATEALEKLLNEAADKLIREQSRQPTR